MVLEVLIRVPMLAQQALLSMSHLSTSFFRDEEMADFTEEGEMKGQFIFLSILRTAKEKP